MIEKLEKRLSSDLEQLKEEGRNKGKESIIVDVKKASGKFGPRYFIKGYGEKPFIRMNSNSYLGLSLREDLLEAETRESESSGIGPGAVRFISGTFRVHRNLEKKLAEFHGREEAMLFNSAYTTVGGAISSLITKDTAVISDELNHNSIINAIRMSRPKSKSIYAHNNTEELKKRIEEVVGAERLLVITDGIFSMRGDHAPLKEIQDMVNSYDDLFPEGATLVVDDSHGVGAFGRTGRGSEEGRDERAARSRTLSREHHARYIERQMGRTAAAVLENPLAIPPENSHRKTEIFRALTENYLHVKVAGVPAGDDPEAERGSLCRVRIDAYDHDTQEIACVFLERL